ncbi:Isochorismatase hydrolase [Amylostereum chailletii]|nr:Isochorismatase hydrolase [Amylostereum chailletii]
MSPTAIDALADHKSRRVLLIIDAQAGMLAAPPKGVPNSAAVDANIAHVLAAARDAAHPPLIVHVRNCGEPGEPDEKGTAGWELVHAPRPMEPVLDKLKNNAFAGTTLGALVAPEDMLVVVGCQSDFCIRATCSAALGRGNDVVLIRGAHATYDRVEVLAGGGITEAKLVEREIEAELSEAGVILLDVEEVEDLFND